MRLTLFPLAVTALLATSVMADELKPVRSITVTGVAERKVVPDEAHLSVNLNAQAPKLADAKSAHDAKLKKLLGLAREAGIDEKKVRTQSSGVQPVYRYENDPKTGRNTRRLDGYRVQTAVDITVGDTSKLGGLMDAVTAAGFEQGANAEWGDLISTYYTLSNPEKIRDEILAEAIANAKQKAVKMAAAVSANVAGVVQLNETGAPTLDFPRPMRPMAFGLGVAKVAESSGVVPPAGEQEVNTSVTVMFELK